MLFILFMFGVAVAIPAPNLRAHPHNLSHSSYLYYDFSDNAFDARYDPKYTRGKHCAAQYLPVDYNTHSYGHALFESCVTSVHPRALREYALVTTRRLFANMYNVFDNYTKHVYLHDQESDSLYETYVDIQHDFRTYKIDIVNMATSFTRPVDALTMNTFPSDAKKALGTSTEIMSGLYNTIKLWSDMYDTVISGKAEKLAEYKTVEDQEWLRLHEYQHTYIENVSTMLKQLTLTPNVNQHCSPGYWCSAGQAVACPAGTFQPARNMTRALACIQTPMGSYSKDGASHWTSCAANTHVGATACHLLPLRDILKPGIITQNFYITHDFSRHYVNGVLLSAVQTANSTSGTLLARVQNLTAGGASLTWAYTTAKLEQLHAENVVAFDHTDLDTATYKQQTNVSRFRIPYAANTYNVSVGATTWSVVNTATNQLLLGGSLNGTIMTGIPSTTHGMVGDRGYPVVHMTFTLNA